MRLLEALGYAGLTVRALSQAELRAVLVDRLGLTPAECTAAQGDGRHRYTLTDLGYRFWSGEKDAPDGRPIELPKAGLIVQMPEVGGLHHRYVRQTA
jgi:hypothetical protein